MDMIAIAVYTRSFLKDLEESTSGREPARPAAEPRGRRSPWIGALARIAAAASAVRCWLRSPRWRVAG